MLNFGSPWYQTLSTVCSVPSRAALCGCYSIEKISLRIYELRQNADIVGVHRDIVVREDEDVGQECRLPGTLI